MLRGTQRPTLFPYTTLFRSGGGYAIDDPRGEEVGRDALAGVGAQDEPVDLVLQLAHVAGPRVALEEPERELENRSEEHTSELQSREKLVCRLLLEKKNRRTK